MVVTRSAGTFLHHDITAKYIIAMTQIDRDENFLPLILTLTNLPLLLLSAQAQLLLHQPNLTHILHHASQRRRILRQRPHRGRQGRCPRRLWRRTYPHLPSSISSLRLTDTSQPSSTPRTTSLPCLKSRRAKVRLAAPPTPLRIPSSFPNHNEGRKHNCKRRKH